MAHINQDLETSRQYAWNYFALHANQRITVFNFFVVMSGAVTAGIAGALQASSKLALFGILLGPLLSLLSFVFWKLDQRVSFLIKHAEHALSNIEDAIAIEPARLFSLERQNTEVATLNIASWSKQWSYRSSFRLIFAVMAVIGVAATAVSVLKFCGKISW